jgi:hypothetical protein
VGNERKERQKKGAERKRGRQRKKTERVTVCQIQGDTEIQRLKTE